MVAGSSGNTNWNPLDVIFVLFSSITLVLLGFWISAQLVGQDQLDSLPPWFTAIGDKFWTFLVSGSAAVLTNWLNSNRTNRPSYLLWIMGFSAFFVALIFGVHQIFFKPDESEDAGQLTADLHVRIPFEGNQNLEFIQKSPVYIPQKFYAKQSSGFYEIQVNLPPVNNTFSGVLAPQITDSEYSNIDIRKLLCFTREEKCESPHDITIRFNDSNPVKDEEATSCKISLCPGLGLNPNSEDLIFHFASFQSATPSWHVPTLENLKKYQPKGYSLFTISSDDIESSLPEGVKYYTYEVSVNGTRVLFNGFEPDDLRYVFDPDNFSFQFGLQSLNFSGTQPSGEYVGGFEAITVRLRFFREEDAMLENNLALDYVAFRNFNEQDLQAADGTKFKWKVDFIRGDKYEYEVFVFSSPDGNLLLQKKKAIDEHDFVYKGRSIKAVLRPPLKTRDNPNYGIILGLVRPSGQIDVTFGYNDAKELLNWIKKPENVKYFRSDAYLYHVARQFQ